MFDFFFDLIILRELIFAIGRAAILRNCTQSIYFYLKHTRNLQAFYFAFNSVRVYLAVIN